MKGIKINIFYVLAFFYFCINLYYAIYGYLHGEMFIEFQQKVMNKDSFLIAFFLQSIFILYFVLVFMIFNSNLLNKKETILLSDKFGIFLLVIQLMYFCVNAYYGVGIAGETSETSAYQNPIIKYFFIIIQVDILYFFINILLKSRKLFYINNILYIFRGLLSGWAGVVLLVLVNIFIYENIKIRFKSFFITVLLISFIFFSLPFIIQIKFTVREHENIMTAISYVFEYGYTNYLLEVIDYVFLRMQHVGQIALIIDNSDYFTLKYGHGYITPYWAEGLPQTIFMNICHIKDSYIPFSRLLTIDLFGASQISSWTVNTGVAGWVFILGYKFILYLIYICIFMIFIPFFFLSKYGNHKLLQSLAVFSLVYLFHGWIGSYFTMVFYYIIILIVIRAKL